MLPHRTQSTYGTPTRTHRSRLQHGAVVQQIYGFLRWRTVGAGGVARLRRTRPPRRGGGGAAEFTSLAGGGGHRGLSLSEVVSDRYGREKALSRNRRTRSEEKQRKEDQSWTHRLWMVSVAHVCRCARLEQLNGALHIQNDPDLLLEDTTCNFWK